ncbi:hypothetical protein AAVH_39275, partial [Aphelenchoides avenae]
QELAYIFAMECAFYVVQFGVGSYFFVRMRKISLVHVNLRILLCNFYVHFSLFGVGRLGEMFSRRTLPTDELPLRNSLCLLWRLIHEAGMPFSALFFMWIAVERLMATVVIKTYEQKGKAVGVGIVVVVYSLSIGASVVGIVYDTVISPTFDVYTSTVSCQMIVMHPSIFPVSWLVCGVGYVTAVI